MKKQLYYMLLLLISMLPPAVNAAAVQPFLDLLAWKAAESNTSWATTVAPITNTSQVTPSSINFNTRLGMKAGFLYAPENNFWDTKFYWTYFPTNASQSIAVGNQIVSSLFFSGSYFISGDIFFGGSANWQLVMNTLDLEINHHFKPTPALTLSPKIGVKAASINQDIRLTWDAIVYTSTERMTSNFSGIGPSFGVEGKWGIFRHFNVVGDISTALMYGNWNIKDSYNRRLSFLGLIPPQSIITNLNQSKLGTLMMDYYLGLEWTHQGRSRVTVKLGYEMQYWANQVRLISIQQLPTLGDLTIQGASCGIIIDL